jgi:hypothetical protein
VITGLGWMGKLGNVVKTTVGGYGCGCSLGVAGGGWEDIFGESVDSGWLIWTCKIFLKKKIFVTSFFKFFY